MQLACEQALCLGKKVVSLSLIPCSTKGLFTGYDATIYNNDENRDIS